MPRTFLVLDLSTAHLPPGLRRDLASHASVVASPDIYGVWVWEPADPYDSALSGEDLPDVLLDLQRFAPGEGCDWIRFDVDAEIDLALATFPDEPS